MISETETNPGSEFPQSVTPEEIHALLLEKKLISIQVEAWKDALYMVGCFLVTSFWALGFLTLSTLHLLGVI